MIKNYWSKAMLLLIIIILIISTTTNNNKESDSLYTELLELDEIIVTENPFIGPDESDEEYEDYDVDWELFVKAITFIESEFQDSAINKSSGARGQFQILPIFVKEANRLQSIDTFTWDDAFEYEPSRMMFDIIQNAKNPTKDKRLACRIHYGSYSIEYYNKVMNAYNRFLNEYQYFDSITLASYAML